MPVVAHYSASDIQEAQSVKQSAKPNFKPRGLWYDLNREWKSFATESDMVLGNRHNVTIDRSRILILKTGKDVDTFRKKYERLLDREFEVIDWKSVAKRYAGIEIHHPRRFKDRPTWLETWDVSSGCVWDMSAVLKVRKAR